jgi:hypothetical protein
MAIGYTPLPQFRDPGPLDFSPLHSALDDWAKSREKNRLLEEAKEIGASLQPAAPGQASTSYAAQPVNRLLSPAQSSAAAAGRDYPIASPGDPSLPAGMRNNNPGNIKYIPGAKYAGLVGPSVNRDQGDPQMVFDTPRNGMIAAADLALRKYQGGKRTATDLIAGNMGWTPGNTGAAANIARTMGVAPDEDLRLDDPQRMQTFLRALTLQEHGAASRGYGDDVYGAAVGGRSQTATAQQAAPARSGMNYDAGIRTALQQGNVALATQLQQAKQEAENLTYTRGRQATQDAQAAESHALTTQGQRETLQKNFTSRVGAIAQTIQSEPDPAKKQAMWQRFIAADPRFTQALRAYGVDPGDVDAGTRTLIAEALGVTGGEESGTTPQYYVDPADGKTKIGVITKQGKFRAVTTPGQVLPPVKPVDTGTGTTFVGPGAAPVGAPIPKDVAGKERQEAVGKGEGERQLAQPATQASVRNSLSGLDRLVQEARELRGMPGVAAMTGSIQGSGWVPTIRQDTANAEAKLETLKSQIAFNVLQAMRDASKTGGALGSIAVEELRMLQNNLASLDTRQGEQAFKDSLDRIMDYADGAKVRLLQGYKGTYGQEFDANAAPPPQNPPAPEADAVRVNSVEEAMALRPGTRFITPDGRTKVRP